MFWFWEKDFDCVHLWVKFSMKNVVLRETERKTLKYFPEGKYVFDKIFIHVPWFHNHHSPPALKISGWVPAVRHYSFWQMFFLTQMFVSVLSTLYQQLLSNLYSDVMLSTAVDKFKILVNSAVSFPRYKLAYSIISSVIKAYSCIFRHF